MVIDPLWRSGSFPHIRATSESLYRLAKKDYKAFLKVKSFEKTYAKIILALNDVSMRLDETGKLTMEFTNPKSLGKLISDAIANKVLDELKGKTIDAVQEHIWMKESEFGNPINRFKIFSAALSYAMLLNEIYTDIDNENLVNEQRGKRRNEARAKKVKFCIAALAAKETGSAMSDQFQRLLRSRRFHFTWREHCIGVLTNHS